MFEKKYMLIIYKMFNCYLCPSDEWTGSGLCSTCHKIKDIIACYSSEEVLESLSTLYLREKDKVENKVNKEKTEYNLRKKEKKCYSATCAEKNIKV
jgi:hypothetical protein